MFDIGARLQPETKLLCLWEESTIRTHVSVLNAAGRYRADLCRRAPMCPPTTVAVSPRSKTSATSQRELLDEAVNTTRRPRAMHLCYLPSVSLLLVRRQPSEEAFRTALPESGRGAEAPGGQRTSGGAQSSQCNAQGHSLWDTELGKQPMKCKSAEKNKQTNKKQFFIAHLCLKQIGPCLRLALFFSYWSFAQCLLNIIP